MENKLKQIIAKLYEEASTEAKTLKLTEICNKLDENPDTQGMDKWFIDENQPNTVVGIRWKGSSYTQEIRDSILEMGYPKPKRIYKESDGNSHWYFVVFKDNVYTQE